MRIANAPCNFGIYSLDSPIVDPDTLLAELSAAGYTGIDSGPIGYLGTGSDLVERLARHGMQLAGGWVDLRYGDADGFAADLSNLDAALDVFAAAAQVNSAGDDDRFAPRPTLACPANPIRFAAPGVPVADDAALPESAWTAFADRVQQAADRCRARGLEPVFHYHLGTDIETGDEADRLLALTDISICLDTGHLTLAGGDAVAAVRHWGPRIKQVHVKDADRLVHHRVREEGADLSAMVRAGGFPAIGQGDVDLPAVLAELTEIGYTGWLVVEQDAPGTGQDLDRILADQRANRAQLAAWGLR
ncbi:MAG: TIM barrel protein [Hamadaea sp.]|uniref:sugar phosphate isomerase/epimerase family protein n=1 Tax=Hamadaea sp. TaxID=2024425 RepID=UPI0017A7B797|nr:sugar phosphate isomerase/epimerase [Hamadaea sp.]NUT20813.1 TIM barrel protein [Hamadaea sp.]